MDPIEAPSSACRMQTQIKSCECPLDDLTPATLSPGRRLVSFLKIGYVLHDYAVVYYSNSTESRSI